MKLSLKVTLAAVAIGLSVLSIASGLQAYAAGPDVQIGSFGLPPPPPLKQVAPPVSAPKAAMQERGTMAPPQPRDRCITKAERNAALMGSGCSCSCQGYARKPVSDRCDIACGIAYYTCWNPLPSDAEAEAMFMSKADPALAALTPSFATLTRQEKDTFRGFMQMERAAAWDDARLCPDSP